MNEFPFKSDGPIYLSGEGADRAAEIIERRKGTATMDLPNGTTVTLKEILEGQKLWRCVTHDKGPQRLPIILGDADCKVEVLSWTSDQIAVRGEEQTAALLETGGSE